MLAIRPVSGPFPNSHIGNGRRSVTSRGAYGRRSRGGSRCAATSPSGHAAQGRLGGDQKTVQGDCGPAERAEVHRLDAATLAPVASLLLNCYPAYRKAGVGREGHWRVHHTTDLTRAGRSDASPEASGDTCTKRGTRSCTEEVPRARISTERLA